MVLGLVAGWRACFSSAAIRFSRRGIDLAVVSQAKGCSSSQLPSRPARAELPQSSLGTVGARKDTVALRFSAVLTTPVRTLIFRARHNAQDSRLRPL